MLDEAAHVLSSEGILPPLQKKLKNNRALTFGGNAGEGVSELANYMQGLGVVFAVNTSACQNAWFCIHWFLATRSSEKTHAEEGF